MGVPRENLPELCDYDACRPLCAAAAELLGLKQGIPVVTAHPDGAMNQVGDDALEEGVMTLSRGDERCAAYAFRAGGRAGRAVALVLLRAGQLSYGRRDERLCQLHRLVCRQRMRKFI